MIEELVTLVVQLNFNEHGQISSNVNCYEFFQGLQPKRPKPRYVLRLAHFKTATINALLAVSVHKFRSNLILHLGEA